MKYVQNSRRKAIVYERALVKHWKKNKTFEKSVEFRPADNAYVFYDGPPFITGVPHYGTLLSSIVKDAIPRYWTMKGKHIERVWGWDCHGLPAENFVEKKLGIEDRHDIGTKITLEDYIKTARESMVQTGSEWEGTIDRIGRWVDFKGGYKTMDKNYMESVWWAFKTLYEKGKIYEGERVLLYDTQWATPLSKAEVTMDAGAYQEVTDPSVFVKFKLPECGASLLAWTTTPWTLPANAALAINPKIAYVQVEIGGEQLILAKELLDKVFVDEKNVLLDYKIVKSMDGGNLITKEYEPLFGNRGKNAHKIWAADFVGVDNGTGIVHIAPAYGEDDAVLAEANGIPVVHVIDDYGKYTEGEWQGCDIWEVNKLIAKTLQDRGDVWKIEYIRHEYPHNPRTGKRLIYRAHPSWFMNIADQRQQMLETNANINWFPPHIKHGRFENTIQTAPDWNLSRDRFWATPMPVWKGMDGDGNEQIKVIGSYQELADLSGKTLDDYHRPWIDDITFLIDGIEYKRIDKVLDCWFESGSMPFAQFHYPFENIEKFEANFPGDFISEYVPQVRAWFYYVHAVSIGLFGKEAYKNVIVTGTIVGNDGRKMSKSIGNFTDPNLLMDTYSADSLRFLLLNSPLLNGEDYAIIDKNVADVNRKLGMVWNMYDFFTLYAGVDGWEWQGNINDTPGGLTNILDIWIISRVHQLAETVDTNMQKYDVQSAASPFMLFIDDASNWYVRRSRKRFWKTTNDQDKNDAYKTLHYVLVMLARLLAPFTPFMAEELFVNLTGQESVHLTDWPQVGHINEMVVDQMAKARELITVGLAQRASAGIKVRQPLALVTIRATLNGSETERQEILNIVADELNVKAVHLDNQSAGEPDSVALDLNLTKELQQEGLARELIRHIQNTRKSQEYNVDDRVSLKIKSDDIFVNDTLLKFKQIIYSEVLAVNEDVNTLNAYQETVEIDGHSLELIICII